MKKQGNKKLIRTFLLLLATAIYIFINISWHQIYYYTHSQKTDKRLTPIVVIYNLGEVMFKPKRETDGKYEYVSPGNAINYNESASFSYSFISDQGVPSFHTSVGVYYHDEDISINFQLDPNFKITNIYKYTPDDITEEKPSQEDQAMVDRYVKQLTDHVLETRVV